MSNHSMKSNSQVIKKTFLAAVGGLLRLPSWRRDSALNPEVVTEENRLGKTWPATGGGRG